MDVLRHLQLIINLKLEAKINTTNAIALRWRITWHTRQITVNRAKCAQNF